MPFRALHARREPLADAACVLLAAAGGLVLLITNLGTHGAGWIHGSASLAYGVDAGLGTLASGTLWFRRRWPAEIAVAIAVLAVLSRSAQLASLISVFNVSLRRRAQVVLAVAGLHQITFIGFALLWVEYPLWIALVWVLTYHVAIVSLGMYVRARQQLIASLRERAENAEATQRLLAEQARHAERARIATEMHDVLAHRVSLMALQAGGLEVRPDLPPDEVRGTAGLIRSTARQALTELREVIGVLHEGEQDEAPASHAPQPTLRDIATLVNEYQQAGLKVDLDMRVETPDAAPGPLGRDTYRIVREALANVSKHARGTAATVSVSGRPGEGLHVMVRNRLPLAGQRGQAALPGAGLGLVGLAERVAVAGGTLSHGPDAAGDFVLTAALRWRQ
ncbi:MAG TPA: histidine kinase [Streptosporangiaceae bacterium]